jgi:DNA-binding NarL/FixJ family response regulator
MEFLMHILLADSQSRVRFALSSLLEEQSELTVVGEATDGPELLAQVEAACPDLVLVDWDLPGMAGADLLAALKGTCPDLHVIVLSSHPEVEPEALAAGVYAFVSKAGPPEPLLAAIHAAKDLWERGSADESQAPSTRTRSRGKGAAYAD